MPLADAFVTPAEFGEELFYDLEVGACEACAMVQLVHCVDARLVFRADYPYLSSSSARMREHFESVARHLMADELPPDGFVVEIGCNDGVMSAVLAEAGVRHLGIEPSAGVAAAAARKGVRVLVDFFGEGAASRIRASNPPADVIYAANVLSHIPDVGGVWRAVDRLLADAGVVVFEEPYLGAVLKSNAFDQFYDEHIFYFSVTSVRRMLELHGFELVDATPLSVHGGSMRYTAARAGRRRVDDGVAAQLATEKAAGLVSPERLSAFGRRVEGIRDRLVELLCGLAADGKRVLGYGATAKSCTAVNYCGITTDLVECIVDTTPSKQGKYSPGAHLPIRPAESFATPYPDFALLFAWNHAEEIMAKEAEFARRGGRWILYVPDVAIVPG
jgi:methylation protein EvaC